MTPQRAASDHGEDHARVGEDRPDVREEARGLLAVDEAMVERQRERHDLPQRDLPLELPRQAPHLAHGDDRRLPRVEDRRAGVDPEDADVRDRDRPAGEVGRARVPLPRRGRASASSASVMASASLMVGTTSPRGVAAAMPRLT